MSEHFIKNIEIKNFKCFDNFKAEGFGRVNLIGGKNNVGKTAFMEACSIIIRPNDNNFANFISLLQIENNRRLLNVSKENNLKNILDIFAKYKNISIQSNDKIFTIEYKEKGLKQEYILNRKFTVANEALEGKFKFDNKININNDFIFIPSSYIDDNLITSMYDKIKANRNKPKFNKLLRDFDKNIDEFDILYDKPQVFLNSIKSFQNISESGDGLKKYILIIASILISKDACLFLDEIENGIHYSNLDKLWEIILTISKDQNVQVFATTHSKECIESYVRVAKRLEDEEIRFIELGRDDDNKITSIVYEYNEIINQVEQHQDIRGW